MSLLLTAVVVLVLHAGCGTTYVAVVKVATSCHWVVALTVPVLHASLHQCVILYARLYMMEVPHASLLLSLSTLSDVVDQRPMNYISTATCFRSSMHSAFWIMCHCHFSLFAVTEWLLSATAKILSLHWVLLLPLWVCLWGWLADVIGQHSDMMQYYSSYISSTM